jgi:hypothetical protein
MPPDNQPILSFSQADLKEAMGRYHDAIMKEPQVFMTKAVTEYDREQYSELSSKEIITHLNNIRNEKAVPIES